jgi:PKD repeat protein
MQLLNFFSRLQWAVLLLLYIAFVSPTVYADPVASFYAEPKSGLVPLIVRVNCKDSSPWEGPDRIIRFEWTTSTGRLIKNIVELGLQLETSGPQTITLTVWNAAGESNSKTETFDVLELPTPDFSVYRIDGFTVFLDASASLPGSNANSITQYEYNWRGPIIEDTPSETIFGGPIIETTSKASITFDRKEEYTISLKVKDNLGNESQTPAVKTVTIDVKPPFLSKSEAGASFYGGVLDNALFLPNESSFPSSTSVGVKTIIEVAPEHIGMKADILVGVQHLPKGQWYLKTESTAFPFIASDLKQPFIAAESSIELESTQGINVFTGHFKNMQGSYNVYFGYLLLDSGILVYNEGTPLNFEVTP